MGGSGQLTPQDSKAWNSQPRGVGRPSLVTQYASEVRQWLREEPALSAADVLRRIRGVGYRGGKSALYELVRRLRVLGPEHAGSKPMRDVTAAGESSPGAKLRQDREHP
jgi:hypothetical protein